MTHTPSKLHMRSAALHDLESLLGPDIISSDTDPTSRYCRDWSGEYVGTPLALARPRTLEQVSAIVRFCGHSGIPLVPQGGHTGLVGGAAPSVAGDELIISLERMNKICHLDSINHSMIVEAGCIVEAAHAAAQSIDCHFPLTFGAQGSAQVGGVVATNAGGFNVLRFGMMRDLVLGLEVVLPDGQLLSALSPLRKNNVGYDLKQLFIGGEGTLGIVTAAALRLFPRPTQCEVAFLAIESVSAAMSLYASARRDLSDLLSAFELIPRLGVELACEAMTSLRNPLGGSAPYYVLLEASASGFVDLRQLMERFLEHLVDQGRVLDGILSSNAFQSKEIWRIREGMVEGQARRGLHLRTDVSTSISLLSEFIDAVTTRLHHQLPEVLPLAYGHVGDGNIHFNVLPPTGLSDLESTDRLARCEEIILEEIDRVSGSISAEHGIGRKRRTVFLQRAPAVQIDVMRRIKVALDPVGFMSPGRIL